MSVSLEKLGEIFDRIYEKSHWAGESNLPLSGPGSTPKNAKPYVEFVQQIIQKYEVKSVVDIGHGDWEIWNNYKFEDTSYIGIEISEHIHNYVKSKFSSKNRSFLLKDIIKDKKIPNGDLIICKDVLQHLNNYNSLELVKLLSNFPLIIICNDFYTSRKFKELIRYHFQIRTRLKKLFDLKNPFYFQIRKNNSNIDNGQCRGVDLEKEPFSQILDNHIIIYKFDYDGPKRNGVIKRVMLFKNIDKNGSVKT